MGGSFEVFAAGVIGVSRDAVCFQLLALSLRRMTKWRDLQRVSSGKRMVGRLGEILEPFCTNRHHPIQRRTYKEMNITIYSLRRVNKDLQAPSLPQRPGYKMQRKHWFICTSKYPKVERQRLEISSAV